MKASDQIKDLEKKFERKNIASLVKLTYSSLTSKINGFNRFSEEEIIRINDLHIKYCR